jgi:hypothetical protein
LVRCFLVYSGRSILFESHSRQKPEPLPIGPGFHLRLAQEMSSQQLINIFIVDQLVRSFDSTRYLPGSNPHAMQRNPFFLFYSCPLTDGDPSSLARASLSTVQNVPEDEVQSSAQSAPSRPRMSVAVAGFPSVRNVS